MSSSFLPERVYISEEEEKTLDCPPETGKQLQRAAFDQESANKFVKTRTPQGGDDARPVVTAIVEGDELTISVEDVVGVVELTPTSKLQINPKIGWDDILTMFLAIQESNRSLEYQGVPIDDFLSDDIQIRDIFVVITVNYLSSLQVIHRNGFIRQFSTDRYDALTGKGRIDIEKSVLNLQRGIPRQRFIQKNIDYNTPVNSLIYHAGTYLLRLFQAAESETHEQYFKIFSELREGLNRLESVGVNPSAIDLREVRSLSIEDLPRQRRYYEEALRISKTVLSSATGQSLASGAEDLTLDFILDMDHLFEQYSQVVLEQELDELSENPLYGELEGVFVRDEPTIHVYEEGTGSYRPDHVLCSDDGTVAVLDSKYYSQDTDPSQHTTSRTSMLAYAYLLETEEMVFLTPSGEEKTRSLAERNGNVTVVSAGSEFTTDSYRDEIREYLMSALDDLSTNTGIRKYVGYPIAHQGVHGTDINEIILNENLELDGDTVSKARSVVEAAIEKSDQVNKHKIYRGADTNAYFQYVKEVKEFILEAEEKYNLVVPFFIPSSADEPVPETGDRKGAEEGDLLKIYAANREDGTITNISEHPKHISLDW